MCRLATAALLLIRTIMLIRSSSLHKALARRLASSPTQESRMRHQQVGFGFERKSFSRDLFSYLNQLLTPNPHRVSGKTIRKLRKAARTSRSSWFTARLEETLTSSLAAAIASFCRSTEPTTLDGVGNEPTTGTWLGSG